MPDWFYRPVARPLLFRLPDPLARACALGVIGGLARLPGGGRLIDFLGHMRPAPALAVNVRGRRYPSPFLLGWRVDPERRALAGLARFGAGGLEIGPTPAPKVVRTAEGLRESRGATRADAARIDGDALGGVPLLRRLRDADGREHVAPPGGERWPVLAWDKPPSPSDPPATGVVLQVGARDAAGHWTVPLRPPAGLLAQVVAWRQALGAERALVVAGGVQEPAEAVALREAGADLVLIDAGLVFSGPGLLKRANTALLAARSATADPCLPAAPEHTAPTRRQAWFWAAALGGAMLGGGLLALGLAATRVLLPYDEHYLGLTAAELGRVNARLLAFMAHDRATLAGTMLGLGWLYWRLARDGIRRGDHAAWWAVSASALTGFASFFYFLGFGYFDPLHAFVTAVLFQLLLLILTGEEGATSGGETRPSHAALDQREDAAWRRAQWGQLLLVVHACGLLGAGVIISVIGLTRVFVAEDLAFLCIGPGELPALGERLIAVVAHDRATLGGMLLAAGVGSLLPTLWSFERGARTLRDAFVGLGAPAYAAAIGVHHVVGYVDWRHLLPAWFGALLWAGGLALSWRYLGDRRPALARA